MLAQIDPELLKMIPPKWGLYLLAGYVIAKDLGRIYWAVRNGGGLISIWRGLVYGTNTPKPTDNQNKSTN